MSEYFPDRWVVIEVSSEGETLRRVLGSWWGGFGGGDSWRASSGIIETTEFDDRWEFLNHSGSVYVCAKGAEGMSGYTSGVYAGWLKNLGDEGTIKIIDFPAKP